MPPPAQARAPSSIGETSQSRSTKRSREASTDSDGEDASTRASSKAKGTTSKSKGKGRQKGKSTIGDEGQPPAPKAAKKRRNVSAQSTPATDSQFLNARHITGHLRGGSQRKSATPRVSEAGTFSGMQSYWGGSSSGGSSQPNSQR